MKIRCVPPLPLFALVALATLALAACAGQSHEGEEGHEEEAAAHAAGQAGGELRAEGEHAEGREGGEHAEGGERGEREGGEHGERESGEHGEGGHDESGEGEEPGIYVERGESWDMVRRGARLVLAYDAGSDAFVGRVENTTEGALCAVRVEVRLRRLSSLRRRGTSEAPSEALEGLSRP